MRINFFQCIRLYYHTIKYLKYEQIYWRLFYKFNIFTKIKSIEFAKRTSIGFWISPIKKKQSFFSKDTFLFLNQEGKLNEVKWSGIGKDKLWCYNLHYFDDLNSQSAYNRTEIHTDLIHDWIEKNEVGCDIAWDPYPTSLRSVNFIKWIIEFNILTPQIKKSLTQHGLWLEKKIEWHILGNHLFANAKALIFLGYFLDGPEANRWFKIGCKILETQIEEQVLEDGGHFERSPMYHSIILEDILDIINLDNLYEEKISKNLINFIQKMLSWLEDLSHPDGQIAFFNDSSFDISSTYEQLFLYAERLNIVQKKYPIEKVGISLKRYSNTGYIRLNSDKFSAIMDVGHVGPDYQPGHAHADTLSFELSVLKERIFVNSGTSTYVNNKLRRLERSTRSHNTVEINGLNSTEIWSGFRVAKRANPYNLHTHHMGGKINISCSHDGYHRFMNKTTHSRSLVFSEKKISIIDNIYGKFNHAVINYHLHPSVDVVQLLDNKFIIYCSHSDVELTFIIENANGRLEDNFYSPEFGKRIQSKKISIDLIKSNCCVNIC